MRQHLLVHHWRRLWSWLNSKKNAGLLLVQWLALDHAVPGTANLSRAARLPPHLGEELGREHLLAGPMASDPMAADSLSPHEAEELDRTARVAIRKLRTHHGLVE